ncbi:hypothetical protein [Acetatifactor muris]|nr:hypothetical protein [Acetatifactor muris]
MSAIRYCGCATVVRLDKQLQLSADERGMVARLNHGKEMFSKVSICGYAV